MIFPFIFIGALGGTLSANFGRAPGFDFLTLTFTGVYAQTLFQSTAMGMISLVIDRENDFSQELFIAPVSRYTIVAEGTPEHVKRDLTHEYLVVDAADRDALRYELTAKGITHRETPLFELPLEDRGVQALIRSIDTPLTTVRTVAPSLEDAYIKVLARS